MKTQNPKPKPKRKLKLNVSKLYQSFRETIGDVTIPQLGYSKRDWKKQ